MVLRRWHLHEVNFEDYVVTPFLDGIPVQLVFGKFQFCGSKPFCVLVNSIGEIYQLEVYGPGDLFRGSVFDAQICDGFVYVMDVLCSKGEKLGDQRFDQRYLEVQTLFVTHRPEQKEVLGGLDLARRNFVASADPSLKLRAKSWTRFTNLGSIVRRQEAAKGYLFLPTSDPVRANQHTTYFILHLEAPSVNVQAHQGSLYCVGHDHKLGRVPGAPGNVQMEDGIYQIALPSFHPQRARPDILRPDHVRHVTQCQQVLQDTVSLGEILNFRAPESAL